MFFRCASWVCSDTKIYDKKVRCHTCNVMVKQEDLSNDIIRVFALAKLYVESRGDATKEQKQLAVTNIENIYEQLDKKLKE